MLSKQELDEIRKREQAATKGPWEAQEPAMAPGIRWGRVKGPKATREYYGSMCFDRIEDVEFIAHARTDIPALLADVEFWKKKYAEAHKAECPACSWYIPAPPRGPDCTEAREILKEK